MWTRAANSAKYVQLSRSPGWPYPYWLSQHDVAAAGRSSHGGSFLNAVATVVGQAAPDAAGLGTLIAYIHMRYIHTYIPTCSVHSTYRLSRGVPCKAKESSTPRLPAPLWSGMCCRSASRRYSTVVLVRAAGGFGSWPSIAADQTCIICVCYGRSFPRKLIYFAGA